MLLRSNIGALLILHISSCLCLQGNNWRDTAQRREGEWDTKKSPFSSANPADEASSEAMLWTPVKFDHELDRIFGDVLAMQQVRKEFNPTNLTREAALGMRPKVAYLFMVKDTVDQYELWKTYFQEAPFGSYSIYVHQYKEDSEDAAATRELWSSIGAKFIPRVHSGWCQLAGIEFGLFWEALRDPANSQFVLLSEGTVPLKSALYVNDFLLLKPNVSKLCFAMPKGALYLIRGELNGQCTYKDVLQSSPLPTRVKLENGSTVTQQMTGRVRKHHQWLVLARQHVVDVLENGEDAVRRYLSALSRIYSGSDSDPALLGCADEGFVSTALLLASEKRGEASADSLTELRNMGVESTCTTFVYWRHCMRSSLLGGLGGFGSAWKEMKFLTKKFLNSPRRFLNEIGEPRKTPLKKWNDTPRDFGSKNAQPTKEYLELLVRSGLLFARKFGKDEHNHLSRDLASELPHIWQRWEEEHPRTPQLLEKEHRAWPFLDTSDVDVQRSLEDHYPETSNLSSLLPDY